MKSREELFEEYGLFFEKSNKIPMADLKVVVRVNKLGEKTEKAERAKAKWVNEILDNDYNGLKGKIRIRDRKKFTEKGNVRYLDLTDFPEIILSRVSVTIGHKKRHAVEVSMFTAMWVRRIIDPKEEQLKTFQKKILKNFSKQEKLQSMYDKSKLNAFLKEKTAQEIIEIGDKIKKGKAFKNFRSELRKVILQEIEAEIQRVGSELNEGIS